MQIDYFKTCGVVSPKSSLTGGEISNDADYLTDLVVGADRDKRYPEYSAAYDKSSVKQEMMSIVSHYAKVWGSIERRTYHLAFCSHKLRLPGSPTREAETSK